MILDVYAAREDPEPGVTGASLAGRGGPARHASGRAAQNVYENRIHSSS